MPRPLSDILDDLGRAIRQTVELARLYPMMRPALAALQLQHDALTAIHHELARTRGTPSAASAAVPGAGDRHPPAVAGAGQAHTGVDL